MIASHGPVGYVRALLRDVRYASSDASPTAVASASNFRVDLAGMAARIGLGATACDGALVLSGALLVLAVLSLGGRGKGRPMCAIAAAVGVTVLLPVHADYDLAFALLALAAAAVWMLESRGPSSIAAFFFFLLPVVDLHRISQGLLGFSLPQAEAIDTGALLLGSMSALWALSRSPSTALDPGHVPARRKS